MVDRFYLLKYGLALILTFVGVKMLGERFFEIDIVLSLAIILGMLARRDRGVDDLAEDERTGGDRAPNPRLTRPQAAPVPASTLFDRVADVEQDLEVELLAAIGEVERRHLRVVAASPSRARTLRGTSRRGWPECVRGSVTYESSRGR